MFDEKVSRIILNLLAQEIIYLHQIPEALVTSKIYIVRNKRIMLDRDLAELYEVETKVLNQAVKRNIERFPEEFMFQLTTEEFEILKSQIVTSSWGGTRKIPYV